MNIWNGDTSMYSFKSFMLQLNKITVCGTTFPQQRNSKWWPCISPTTQWAAFSGHANWAVSAASTDSRLHIGHPQRDTI